MRALPTPKPGCPMPGSWTWSLQTCENMRDCGDKAGFPHSRARPAWGSGGEPKPRLAPGDPGARKQLCPSVPNVTQQMFPGQSGRSTVLDHGSPPVSFQRAGSQAATPTCSSAHVLAARTKVTGSLPDLKPRNRRVWCREARDLSVPSAGGHALAASAHGPPACVHARPRCCRIPHIPTYSS